MIGLFCCLVHLSVGRLVRWLVHPGCKAWASQLGLRASQPGLRGSEVCLSGSEVWLAGLGFKACLVGSRDIEGRMDGRMDGNKISILQTSSPTGLPLSRHSSNSTQKPYKVGEGYRWSYDVSWRLFSLTFEVNPLLRKSGFRLTSTFENRRVWFGKDTSSSSMMANWKKEGGNEEERMMVFFFKKY